MEYAIEAQKNYLKENLEIEPLRKFDSTKMSCINLSKRQRAVIFQVI